MPYTDSVKILGVILDEVLAWSPQAALSSKKCFAALSRLRKCQNYIPQPTKLILVKSLVFPHLAYCASLFLDLSVDITRKLERYKNEALRFALDLRKFDHISFAYLTHDILIYTARCDYLSICLLASTLLNDEPQYLTAKFEARVKKTHGSRHCHAPPALS